MKMNGEHFTLLPAAKMVVFFEQLPDFYPQT